MTDGQQNRIIKMIRELIEEVGKYHELRPPKPWRDCSTRNSRSIPQDLIPRAEKQPQRQSTIVGVLEPSIYSSFYFYPKLCFWRERNIILLSLLIISYSHKQRLLCISDTDIHLVLGLVLYVLPKQP